MTRRIDSLEQLDLQQLKAEDLRWQYGTGQSVSRGSGRNKRYAYRTGVQTPVGDIELGVWIKAAELLVERDGLQEELARLEPYMLPYDKRNPAARRNARAALLAACLSGLYRDPRWVHFEEYSRKYHPELREEDA